MVHLMLLVTYMTLNTIKKIIIKKYQRFTTFMNLQRDIKIFETL